MQHDLNTTPCRKKPTAHERMPHPAKRMTAEEMICAKLAKMAALLNPTKSPTPLGIDSQYEK